MFLDSKNESDFASHGADLYLAFWEASPKPLIGYRSLLDFGCGCGRLARMFKGHPHKVAGCDIDWRHVQWMKKNLQYMDAMLSSVHPPLPYSDKEFDAIVSISIFTHLNENAQDEFLEELHRICCEHGHLFLTVHGAQALHRAKTETRIRDMIAVEDEGFQRACREFDQGLHAFILQDGHLTTVHSCVTLDSKLSNDKVIQQPYEYGITFIPESYIRRHWGQWFHVVDYLHGAIHSFQDMVVLRPKV